MTASTARSDRAGTAPSVRPLRNSPTCGSAAGIRTRVRYFVGSQASGDDRLGCASDERHISRVGRSRRKLPQRVRPGTLLRRSAHAARGPRSDTEVNPEMRGPKRSRANQDGQAWGFRNGARAATPRRPLNEQRCARTRRECETVFSPRLLVKTRPRLLSEAAAHRHSDEVGIDFNCSGLARQSITSRTNIVICATRLSHPWGAWKTSA